MRWGDFWLASSFLSITARINQIIAGLALNLLALGATGYANTLVFGTKNGKEVPSFSSFHIPGLGSIPLIGRVFFDQTMFTYLAAVVLVIVVVYLQADSERPRGALCRREPRGRRRSRDRGPSHQIRGGGRERSARRNRRRRVDNRRRRLVCRKRDRRTGIHRARSDRLRRMAAARRRRRLPAVRPRETPPQIWANVLNVNVSSELLSTAPYVVTIIALVALGRRGRAPSALGLAYVRGER